MLNRLGKSHELILMWVPGHQGIPGNEIADRLAGPGTHIDPDTPVVGVPFARRTKKHHQRLVREGALKHLETDQRLQMV